MTRSRSALTVSVAALVLVAGGPPPARAQAFDPAVLRGADSPPNALWLEQLDFSAMTSGWGTPRAGRTVDANPLLLGRALYPRGIGTHSASEWTVALHGEAVRFLSDVGVLDEVACGERTAASVRYLVKADGRVVADSGVMRWGDAPKRLDADLTGAANLTLVVDPVETIHMDHAAWAGALLVLAPEAPTLRAAARPAAAVKPRASTAGAVPLSNAMEAVQWLNGAALPTGTHSLDALVAQAPGATPVAAAKTPFPMGGITWTRGIAGLAERDLEVDLGGQAHRFMSFAGILDDATCAAGDADLASARFQVFVDGVKKADSGAIAYGSEPVLLMSDLVNAKTLRLVVQGGMAPDRAAAAWAGALITMGPGATFVPVVRPGVPDPPVPMASGTDPRPAIHHPRVVGTTPGRPFLFRIPATGQGPLAFSASGLPAGVTLDSKTGILGGSVNAAGTTVVGLSVTGPRGLATARLKIVAAEHALVQTPPLGWNSWNVWGLAVDEAKVKAAADAMVASGLAARGFSYVNIDDGWEKGRDASGEILANEKFPDMKALADYVHSKGLKLGIYSSPGPKTCGGYEGSYQHEARDARTYARWGIDYLKYDWCSYGEVVKGDSSLPTLKKPYEVMRAALDAVDRDIVLSLCQYGMGKVWEWGNSVGGDLWRTTGDITDTWSSLSRIGFGQADLFPHSGPSGWNDPDMLVVGTVGWGPRVRPSRLSPNEQVTHVTLWAVLAAPMLLGSDMAQLDPLTLDLLTNEEVLAVNQDPLGKQGRRVKSDEDGREVWARELEDGTRAVALFNRGAEATRVELRFADLGLTGSQVVRDLWAKEDLGRLAEGWGAIVPRHGALLLKVGTPKQAAPGELTGELKQWHKVTLTLEGPFARERDTRPNPFLDYRFTVRFAHESGQPSYDVPGYFAADGRAGETSAEEGTRWRAHLSPDKAGRWTWRAAFVKGPRAAVDPKATVEAVDGLDGATGSFTVLATDKKGRDFRAHGRLQYANGHYLRFAGSGEHFLKAGPDAPETLLGYADFDGTVARKPNVPLKTWAPHVRDWRSGDPTWKSGRGKGLIGALNYLAGRGVNAFSFLTYNAGGDGDNVWPFVERDSKLHYDCSKLDQWQVVFDHAQALGLYLHFKTQETEIDDQRLSHERTPGTVPEALDGGAVGVERRLYYRELVARFGHALALNWNLGEENTQTPEDQRAMGAAFRELDPYGHLVVIHTHPGDQDLVYGPLLGKGSALTGASLQNQWDVAHQRVLKWRRESAKAEKPWVVANDEQGDAALGVPPDPGFEGFSGRAKEKGGREYDLHDVRRHTLWGTLMAGGAGVEYYFGYSLPQNDLLAEDWRSRERSWDFARVGLDFFREERIPFAEMEPADALVGNAAEDNSRYGFAKRGEVYLVYLPKGGTAELDLSGANGRFTVEWLDPRKGGPLQGGSVREVAGGTSVSVGTPPSDLGDDWLAVVRRRP